MQQAVSDLTPLKLAESLGIEPSRVLPLGTLAVCWLTICLALGKKWRVGDDSNAVDQVWNLTALLKNSPAQRSLARGHGDLLISMGPRRPCAGSWGAPTRKNLAEGRGIEPSRA